MDIINFLLILSICLNSGISKSITNFKTQQCSNSLRILDCVNDIYPVLLSKLKQNKIIADYRSNCIYDRLIYNWEIVGKRVIKLENYQNKNILIIEPYFLQTGNWLIDIEINEIFNGQITQEKSTMCEINIKPELPIPIITGGNEKIIEANQDYIVDGSKSINLDLKSANSYLLDFKWKCKLNNRYENFCNQTFPNQNSIKIDQKYCQNTFIYEFILNIKTKSMDDNQWITTIQIIKIQQNVIELDVICLKNCPPFTLFTTKPYEIIYLKAICLKNCQQIDNNSYKWTIINDNQFDYDQNTQFGRYNEKFIIKNGVLLPGRQYNIQLSLNNNLNGGCMKIINIPLLPTINQCTVQPQQGVALKTLFKVNCKYKGDIVNFIIFTTATEPDEGVIIGESPKLENIEFLLPTNVKVFIKIIDERDFVAISQLQVQVDANFPGNINENQTLSLIYEFNNTTESFIINKKYNDAFQIIDGLIEEYNNGGSAVKKQQKLIQKSVLESLKKIPIITKEMAKNMAALATKISKTFNLLSDPYLSLDATNLCTNSANKQNELMRNESFPKSLTEECQNASKILLQCGDLNSQPNIPEIINNTEIIITTPYPPLDIDETIIEDYADYDDYERETKRVNFERISRNSIKICQITTNTIIKTMEAGENYQRIDLKFMKTFFGKFIGDDLMIKNHTNFDEITLKKTKNFQKTSIEISVCIWSKDLFWWTLNDFRLLSKIVFIKFTNSNNQHVLDYFEKPLEFVFKIDKNKIKEKIHKIEFPSKLESNDRSVVVIKTEILQNQSFYVEFVNLSINLKVGVVVMRKPKISDLNIAVSNRNNLFYFINDKNNDNWWYIGVLPQDLNIPKGSIFHIKIYTVGCYFWNFSRKDWEFSCQGKLDNDYIHCKCYHCSVLSAQINDNTLKIDKLTINHDWKMELIWCPIIFLQTIFILSFYLILIVFTIIKQQNHQRNIYLLCDINCLYRNLYIIIVETGWRRYAGTTSNICLRIIGDQNMSLPHLLNYPDPELRLLQRNNEDWFFVTTEQSLGDLKEIEIWSSFNGQQPSWYCCEIHIVNLQNNIITKFLLNRWLNLNQNNQIYYKITKQTTTNDETKSMGRFVKILDKCTGMILENPHFINAEYYERLIFYLSINLTLGFVNLLILDLPKFKLNDSFSYITDYNFNWEMVWIPIVSILITFIGHTGLLYNYKPINSNKHSNTYKKKFLTILIININVMLVILIICGFWLPPILSWYWLIITLIEYLIYFFIIQNLYNLYQNYKLPIKSIEIKEELKECLQLAEKQREFLIERFGPTGLRPYLNHLYQRIDNDELIMKKAKYKQTLEISELLQDTIMFIIYIILLYFVLLADKDNQTIYSNKEILNIISGKYSHTFQLEEIKSIDDIYKYLSETLIEVMQSLLWYGRYFIKDPGMISDLNNKYTGVVRLRQHRITPNSCQLPSQLFQINYTCQGEYLTKPFFNKIHNTTTELDRLYFVWEYTDAYRAGTSNYFGKLSLYPGGGYLAPLGRTLHNSYVNLDYLLKKKWLDQCTRAVFIEFLIYNVNTNLFNAVCIIIEISASGYIRIKPDIQTFKLLLINHEIATITILLFISFFIVFLMLFWRILKKFTQNKLELFKQFWCLIDIIIIFITIIGFCLFLYRDRLVGDLLDEFEKSKHNQFLDYFQLIYGNEILLLFTSILLTISTIRLWKMVRYGIMFKIMEKTIIDSTTTILSLLCCHLLIIFSYGLLGFMIFGKISNHFRDISDTMITLSLLSLNLLQDFNFNSITNLHYYPIIGYFFYVTYMLITLLITTLYITIIMIHYANAREYYSNIDNLDDLPEYLKRKHYFYTNLFKIRLKRLRGGGGGVDDNLQYLQNRIQPKSDEHRYRNSLTIEKSKLTMMKCLIKLNLEQYNDDDDEKFQLMLKIIGLSLSSSMINDDDEKEIFFKEKLVNNRNIKLITDDRIVDMENIVKKLIECDKVKEWKLRRQSRYKRIIEHNINQLDFFKDMLATLCNVASGIKIET